MTRTEVTGQTQSCLGMPVAESICNAYFEGRMRTASYLLTFLMLGTAAEGNAADMALPLDQAMKTASGPTFRALSEKTEALERSGDASGLAAHIGAMKIDPDLDSAIRERLLYDSIKAAGRLPPRPRLRIEIEALATYRSETFVWTDEHGHREYRPLFDVATASRQVQRVWTERLAFAETKQSIAAQDPGIVSAFAGYSGPERLGATAAFTEASSDQLAIYQPALMTALEAGQPVGEIAVATAQKMRDPALMARVLSLASPDIAVRSVERVESEAWSGESARLLAIAAQRPETSSAALLALGRLAAHQPGAREYLLDALGSPSGASAAAALARIGGSEIVERLGFLLRSDADEITRRHALLGLRLTDTGPADAQLAAFARDPAAPPELVMEVPVWLRD
jgi:hypothetical protein